VSKLHGLVDGGLYPLAPIAPNLFCGLFLILSGPLSPNERRVLPYLVGAYIELIGNLCLSGQGPFTPDQTGFDYLPPRSNLFICVFTSHGGNLSIPTPPVK
jgi:hypothetical protein